MLCLALTALWAWGTNFPLTAAAETQQVAVAHETDSPLLLEQHLDKRQASNASACKAYGVDYQDGGSYFVDQQSTELFSAVTQFEGCQPSTADVLLVNGQTAQQYACGQIATAPDQKAQIATCQIRESDMKSGNWSLLILGDNALKGKPFAYQRDFALNVAPQKTVTVSKTCVYTYTEKPTRTVTSTYMHPLTSTIPNSHTITKPAATNILTVTPRPSTHKATSTITRTFTTWMRTEDRKTAVVTPQCTVPPKQVLPDGQCKIVPTIVPAPKGIEIRDVAAARVEDRALDVQEVRKRFGDAASSTVVAQPISSALASAGPPAGLTVTAPIPFNSTITVTLPPKTLQIVSTTTSIIYTTAPPKTIVLGAAMQTTTLPARTETMWQRDWTRVYEVSTMSVGWTWTSTKSVGPKESAVCRANGGHF